LDKRHCRVFVGVYFGAMPDDDLRQQDSVVSVSLIPASAQSGGGEDAPRAEQQAQINTALTGCALARVGCAWPSGHDWGAAGPQSSTH
jgi:hypothetical protein